MAASKKAAVEEENRKIAKALEKRIEALDNDPFMRFLRAMARQQKMNKDPYIIQKFLNKYAATKRTI